MLACWLVGCAFVMCSCDYKPFFSSSSFQMVLIFKTFVTLQGVAGHWGVHVCCRIQTSPQYMTTCVQGDNVKLKMVVDCDRLVLVCVVMQKKVWFLCVWNIHQRLKAWSFRGKLYKCLQFVDPVFFPHRIPFVWCNGWELIFWTHREAICVLDYIARVTSSGFRPRL